MKKKNSSSLKIKSEYKKLNLRDILQGFFTSAIAGILAYIYPFIQTMQDTGEFPVIDKALIVKVLGIGLGFGLAWVFHKVWKNSKGKYFKKED